jgi:outer membrane protein assembly factor BamD (BamD/ComL family)
MKERYQMFANRRVVLVLALLLVALGVAAQETPDALASGIQRFQAGQYSQAITTFQAIIADPSLRAYHGHAYYWVARTRLAQARLEDAAESYGYFLSIYGEHPYAEQAEYDRARVHYLAEEYEQAIQAFSAFVDSHPNNELVANALYWTAECLFSLGRIDSARRYFVEVVEEYPSSYRVEAARYRIDIVDLKQREQELLRLLRWSHEEYLAALEEFQDRERAYEEALRTYRQRLANLAAEDFQAEIETLSDQLQSLTDQLAERDRRIGELLGRIRRLESQETSEREPDDPSSAGTASTATAAGDGSAGAEQVTTDTVQREELLALKLEALQLMQSIMAEGRQP